MDIMGGGTEVISDGVTETVRKYYALAGSTFGMSDHGVMKYLISDHLGSTVAITDNTGTVLSETRYLPFGESRVDVGSLAGTDKTFTGQRDVPDTGLMDYRARLYSTYLNRWTQPDTIIPNITNSQAWNRYSYVLNRPINYTDPTGHKACIETDGMGNCIVDVDWQIDKATQKQKEKRKWFIENVNIIKEIEKHIDFCVNRSFFPDACNNSAYIKKPDSPQVFIGGQPVITDHRKLNIAIIIDWNNVDYIDLGIDGVGVLADGVSLVFGETIAVPVIAELVGGGVELIGFGKTFFEVHKGETSGTDDLFVDAILNTIKTNPVLVARAGRVVPLVGLVGNAYSIVSNLKPKMNVSYQ